MPPLNLAPSSRAWVHELESLVQHVRRDAGAWGASVDALAPSAFALNAVLRAQGPPPTTDADLLKRMFENQKSLQTRVEEEVASLRSELGAIEASFEESLRDFEARRREYEAQSRTMDRRLAEAAVRADLLEADVAAREAQLAEKDREIARIKDAWATLNRTLGLLK